MRLVVYILVVDGGGVGVYSGFSLGIAFFSLWFVVIVIFFLGFIGGYN